MLEALRPENQIAAAATATPPMMEKIGAPPWSRKTVAMRHVGMKNFHLVMCVAAGGASTTPAAAASADADFLSEYRDARRAGEPGKTEKLSRFAVWTYLYDVI